MARTTWIRNLFRPRPSATRKPRKRRHRLAFENLEDRTVPSLLGTFELDANVVTTTTHDWDQVYADLQTEPPGTTSGAVASSFVTDAFNSRSDDIFTGGGSKDTLGIQSGQWLFKNGKPQAKDDITHAYAAAYTDPVTGNLLLYVGLDRYDNSGDATVGFWFFSDKIDENPDANVGGGHPFIGTHSDGDILLVSDFTQGGSVSTIQVYRWTGDDATGSLVPVVDPNPGVDTFATVNGGPISTPWPYLNKSGETQPAHGEFFEGGVDLTALGLHGCFASFLAETRSSQSPTATLSDFVLGDFPLCSIEAGVGSGGLSKIGDPSFYSLTVTNTGALAMFPEDISDTVLGDILVDGVVQPTNGIVTSITYDPQHVLQVDGSLAAGDTLTILVTRIVQPTDPDPIVSTTTYVFNHEADFGDEQVSDTTDSSTPNSINLFQPSATMTVTANPTSTSTAGQVITYTIALNNTSSSDTPNLQLGGPNDAINSLTDSLLGNLEDDAIAALDILDGVDDDVVNLASGQSVSFTVQRQILPTDPTTLTNLTSLDFSIAGTLGNGDPFDNDVLASDDATVTLVPTMAATPFSSLSKVGDSIIYPLTVTNTGPVNLYVRNVSDNVLGNIVVNGVVQPIGGAITAIDATALGSGLLAPGASVTIFVTRTVQPGDADHTLSTVTYTYNAKADFSGVAVSTSANNDVNLFQPSSTMTVTANPTSATFLGQVITYTYTVNNTSSSDSPNLALGTANDSFTDTLLGNLESNALAAIDALDGLADGDTTLAPGGSISFTVTRAIQAGDPTPLTNAATVVWSLAQNLGSFDNLISANAQASVTLLPHLTITKVATAGEDVIHPGDTASFTITVTNDGAGPATNVLVTDQLPEPDLLVWTVFSSSNFDTVTISSTDFLTAMQDSLAAGATATIVVNAVIPADIFPTVTDEQLGHPIPTGIFELDGNAQNGAADGDDWDNVLLGDGGGSFAHSSVLTDGTNASIFTTGGSKDDLDINNWQHTAGSVPDKDDLLHAYAALYNVNGDGVLYFGADRFARNGDSQIGFWFFHNDVSLNANGTFSGVHTDGDVLILSHFTQGGSVSTPQVFVWELGGPINGTLREIPIGGSAFAITNSSSTPSPWPYNPKSGPPGSFPTGSFFEGGINLSGLGLDACFATFMAETRSSQSIDATLKDFVLGQFDTCVLELPNTATVSADGIDPITSNQALITVTDGHDDGHAMPQGASSGGGSGAGGVSAPRFLLRAEPVASASGLLAGDAIVYGLDSSNSIEWNWSAGSSVTDEEPMEAMPLPRDDGAMALNDGESDLANLTYELLEVSGNAEIDLLNVVAL